MNNVMKDKVKCGEAIDISECPKWMDSFYDVTSVYRGPDSDVDYCDVKKQVWIWSIGRHKVTGKLYASTNTVFYMNDGFECVWLR